MRHCLAFALILSAAGAFAEPVRLQLLSQMRLDEKASDFGGLSALVVERDGTYARMLNDRGHLFEMWMHRDGAGILDGITLIRQKYLYIFDPRNRPDTEGLALAPDGSLFVAIERPMKVAQYVQEKNWPKRVLPFPELAISNVNRGLEAIAIDALGRLVALPEAPPDGRTDTPILRLEGEVWSEVAQLPKDSSFLTVSADFDPDGRFYVLERAVSLLGFRSRIRRMDLSRVPDTIETIWQSNVGEYDNLEGLSTWKDSTGALRLTLVSDNNFLHVQETQLLEFVLKE